MATLAFRPLAVLMLCAASACAVAQGVITERSVKAAFLYKFAAFVQWPETPLSVPDTPLVIAVLGAEDVADELEAVTAGRKLEQRPVIVRRLREPVPLAGIHVLFVGAREKARMEAIARAAQAASVLTVAEWEGALRQGAVLNFLPVDGRVRFEVSVEQAEKAGLKVSSRMLSVAHNVVGGRP